MGNDDLVTMLSNLSSSLPAVQNLLGGLSYLLGLTFIMSALGKFRQNQEKGPQGGESSKSWTPYAYFLSGAAMLYLPSMLGSLSNTLFGAGTSILEYSGYNPYNIYNAMEILIGTIGIVWFLRGCVLLAHSSNPDQGKSSHGLKGLLFLIAGLGAINFHSTVNMLNYALGQLFILSGIKS